MRCNSDSNRQRVTPPMMMDSSVMVHRLRWPCPRSQQWPVWSWCTGWDGSCPGSRWCSFRECHDSSNSSLWSPSSWGPNPGHGGGWLWYPPMSTQPRLLWGWQSSDGPASKWGDQGGVGLGPPHGIVSMGPEWWGWGSLQLGGTPPPTAWWLGGTSCRCLQNSLEEEEKLPYQMRRDLLSWPPVRTLERPFFEASFRNLYIVTHCTYLYCNILNLSTLKAAHYC